MTQNRDLMANDAFVAQFRRAAKYIHTHRGRTLVLMFSGEAMLDPTFGPLMQDVALLHGLGLRIVLVPGARPQIERRLRLARVKTQFHRGRRITSLEALEHVKAAVGATRVSLEAALSLGFVASPKQEVRLRLMGGNFVVAQPVGVVDGTDHLFTGDVRRIDREGIVQQLDLGAIVILSPIGYSLTGEAFNVGAADVAAAAAKSLAADKLVFLIEGDGLIAGGRRVEEMSPEDAARWLCERPLDAALRDPLRLSVDAVGASVKRAHLIPRSAHGGLLRELFTEEGAGTMVAPPWSKARWATLADAAGILQLIEPLAAAGLLVRRPRELLEQDIERFAVIERDGVIVATVALMVYAPAAAARAALGNTAPGKGAIGEVAALAVQEAYRARGFGDALLAFVEAHAKKQGLTRLFALSTRASQWFLERGFRPGTVRELPEPRRAAWTPKRGSKVVVKDLKAKRR